MRLYKILAFAFTSLFIFSAQAQEVKKWSLQECVTHAYENNLTVQRSELAMDNSEVGLLQGKLTRIPTLSANISNSWRWGRSIDPTTNLFTTQRINSNGASATSNFLVYNGSKLNRSIKQSEMDVQANYYDLEKAKNDVALDVVFGYLQIIFTREILENARVQLNTSRAQLEQTEKLVNAGALPITNKLDLQSQVASNEVNVINAENDVNLAVLTLKQFLLIPSEEPFDIETPELEDEMNLNMAAPSANAVFLKALETQPDIKAAGLRIQSASMGVKIANSDHIPSIFLQGQFFTNFSDQNAAPTGETEQVIQDLGTIGYLNNDPTQLVSAFPIITEVPIREVQNIPTQWADNRSWVVGFNIGIPIYNGWQTRSNVQRAKIQQRLAEVNALETKNLLRQTIERAYNDAQAASKVFNAAQIQVQALEESFRATERSYNVGALNFVDYQVSSFNLFSARSNLVRAKFDYIFRLKVLDFYLGLPLTL